MILKPGTSPDAVPLSHLSPYPIPAPTCHPATLRYGPELRERDPAAFERMRLLLGYYDLPANAGQPRPPPPSHAVINNLQALRFTKDVDPYYKLALLSYRGKLENLQLLQVRRWGRVMQYAAV